MKQQSTPFEFNPSTGQRIMPSMARTAESYRQRYPLGTWRYNPWTGTIRDGRDIANDQTGLLIVPPGEELVAASDRAWIQVNCNPFSPVAGDVLVDVRTLGNDRESQRVPASDVQWSKVAAYRVSELGAPKKVVKPGCLGCENAVCDECGPNTVKAPLTSAPDLLDAAAGHMRDRAATYDKPEGERSMGKTVQAFNAITGRNMEAATKIQSMLVALKAVFETRGDDPVSVEMIDGLLAYAKEIKPVLRESEGWLLMAVLKMVRSEQRGQPHRDSIEDLIAYAALFGEARVGGQ